MKIRKQCLYCTKDFETEQRYINRGHGKFCSSSCSSKYSKSQTQFIPNVLCAWCNKAFYKNESKRKSSKSGLFFCSRQHKDIAQRIGGIKDIQPSHYSDAYQSYRTKALRYLDGKCNKCGYDSVPEILEVNHIDCNRTNNDLLNLELLCPTCHTEYHFTTKTGPWKQRS